MYLTLDEVALKLRVNKETIRIKMYQGKIPGAFRTDGEKGNWRISEEDLEAWLKVRQVHG